MTAHRTFNVLVAGDLPEIDHILKWERFKETYPCNEITVADPGRLAEEVTEPAIDVILVDLAPLGDQVLDLLLDPDPMRPMIMVADGDQSEAILEARRRGLERHVIRLGDEDVDTRMLAQELEAALKRLVQPPSMEHPSFRELFEYAQYQNVTQPFFVAGRGRRLLYANRAGIELVERLHDLRLQVRDAIDAVPLEASPDQFRNHLDDAFAGRPLQIAHTYEQFPEDERFRRLSYRPVEDGNGDVLAVSILVENIGPRVRAERKVEEMEQMLWHHFECSPLPIKVIDTDETIEWCNPAFGELLQAESTEPFEGVSYLSLIHPDDRDQVRESLAQVFDGRAEYAREEVRELCPDGSEVWTDHIAYRMPSETPSDRKALIIEVDVTRQKEAERRAEQSMRRQAIGELADGVAHDFNNALSIVGTVSHLLERRLQEEGREAELDLLDRIERAVDSGTSLTRQLMAFGRGQTADRAVADISTEIQQVGRLLGRTLGEHVDVEYSLAEDLPPVDIAAGPLEQVVMNLAVNARDAVEDDGKVWIETESTVFDDEESLPDPTLEPGEYVVLRVSDNGVGMDEETLRHIFDPFYTTKASNHGTGLGLATVRKIVGDAGGSIDVESTPGVGTTFEIFLPTAPYEHFEETNGDVFAESGSSEARAGRILLIEDEDDLREPYRILLEWEGHEVFVAETLERAHTVVDQEGADFDLVVSDIMLPDGSGVELVEDLRDMVPWVDVVFVSGYAPDLLVDREQLRLEEAVFLPKPVDSETLVSTIAELLAR